MVAIVLGILKIIGILLLVLLGLILAVILSVLFVPVRYRAEAEGYGSLKGCAAVSWFFHLISLRVSYDGETHADFRILWFHPGREKQDERTDEEEHREQEHLSGSVEKQDEIQQELRERVEATEVTGRPAPEMKRRSEMGRSEKVEKVSTEAPAKLTREEKTAEEDERKEKPKPLKDPVDPGTKHAAQKSRFALSAVTRRIRQFITGIKEKIRRMLRRLKGIAKKIRSGKAQWETIRAFLQDEENKTAFRLAKRQIFSIIRHVLPRKLEGKVRFGLGDPYMTGQVLTWISPFYGLYGRHVQVIPEFQETCLEGELKMRGHIRFGTLLFLGFRMLQNKNIRLWIRKWRSA